MWGSNPLLLRHKFWVLSSLLTVCIAVPVVGEGIYGQIVPPASPTCCLVALLPLAWHIGVPQPFFRLFSEEVVPPVAVDRTCPRKEGSPKPAKPPSWTKTGTIVILRTKIISEQSVTGIESSLIVLNEDYSPGDTLEFKNIFQKTNSKNTWVVFHELQIGEAYKGF